MRASSGSVVLYMAHTNIHTSVRRIAALALLVCGTAHADDPLQVTPHARNATGIAAAVTQLMPSIGDCLESDRALGGPAHLRVMIAFDVIESGEIGSLVIDGLKDRAHLSSLPSCLEGTLAAMRFAPGTSAINVQLPLEARATTETQQN
jgi:hypothetical protein